MPITAPPAETAWLLHHILGFDGIDEADTVAVLEEATKLAEGVLGPLDAPGDHAGAVWHDGEVTVPPGFAEAHRAYADGGWIGVSADPAIGGQGLPHVLAYAAGEPFTSANMALSLCPMLTYDAVLLLEAHGSADQKARFVPKLVSGDWSGTMCLTEPQSGSDLGGIRTRAVPMADGGFAITGTKIYITYGEHGMTDNILHLVLARLPDAPPGSAGISLFAVPKINADGSRNGVRCQSIERKMGIHASPTCVMQFDGAEGEMVGAPHKGLPAMFAMMNGARIGVAMQGVALAERAFRRATAYAGDRVQFDRPIIQHPDVRRMLWTMRALALGGRLLVLYAAMAEEPRASLLIPVAKAWATDAGEEAATLGVQVHGGAGFIEDTGAAQHLRDVRIARIYEGTNGIQSLTLLKRGLLRDQGAAVGALLEEIEAADFASPALLHAAQATRTAATWLRQAPARDAEAGATSFASLLGTVVAGWLCAKVAARADAPEAARIAAGVFADQILPRTQSLAATVAAPSAALVGDGAIL